MTRPLRIEFPGVLYHVTARGDRRNTIYFDDIDRREWLRLLTEVCVRFNFVVAAYCQMGNHYHMLIETPDGNLSQGMRQLNSVYSQYFNRRHRQVGHVFQGRFKAILVQKESYLLELARYIVLNPVRAHMVESAEQWPWSSYRSTVGSTDTPAWLDCDWLLERFGQCRKDACSPYEKFVADGVDVPSPLRDVQFQLLLGDQDFVEQFLDPPEADDLVVVCREQRRVTALSLDQYAARFPDRDQAMAAKESRGMNVCTWKNARLWIVEGQKRKSAAEASLAVNPVLRDHPVLECDTAPNGSPSVSQRPRLMEKEIMLKWRRTYCTACGKRHRI